MRKYKTNIEFQVLSNIRKEFFHRCQVFDLKPSDVLNYAIKRFNNDIKLQKKLSSEVVACGNKDCRNYNDPEMVINLYRQFDVFSEIKCSLCGDKAEKLSFRME